MTDWRTEPHWQRLLAPRKATLGGAVLSTYQNDYPLRNYANDPQARAAAFLKAYRCGWFNKAEAKISGDIAMLKRTVAPEDKEGDNETDVVEHDLFVPWDQLDPIGQFLRLMEKPNEGQTGRQLFQKTQIRIDMAGWTYWYLEGAGPAGSGVLPTAIYGISPTRLTPSFDKSNQLLGWVLDKDRPGGGVPFPAYEILPFVRASADDGYEGVGVVEAVWQELPLAEKMAQHTADVLSTGGRLAGMLWPKDRVLEESEFQDAQRAWRNVTSDSNAAKRLLMFPEPMEYTAGASTPAEIGIPELAMLNRDNILTAFPISPYQLGVPMPGGLNSAETRREDRRDYWEGTIHPRVELIEETIQSGLLSLYEAVLGETYDFDIEEPNLDDAATLLAKADAMAAMTERGFDAKDVLSALQLDHIKWTKPEPPPPPVIVSADPNQPPPVAEQKPPKPPVKSAPVTARDQVTDRATRAAKGSLEAFFAAQRHRVTEGIRKTLPAGKAERMKAQPTWWDAEFEDAELRKTMQGVYATVGRGALQEVADTLGRIVFKGATQSIMADLLTYGGERIVDINARTLQALTVELAEGTRRGYSIPQLIDGVPAEGYKGVLGVSLENGTPAFSDLRAETIARTETMLSYNRATVTGYGEFGVTHLLAYDGDEDAECAERNGQEFTIEEAGGIDDHPNGTLVWSPVVDKSWHEAKPEPQTITVEPVIHVHMGDTKMAPPAITVEQPNVQVDVHVPEAVAPVVNVAAPDAPVVNVASPTVNVAAPVVNVKAPDHPVQMIKVEPAPVTVNVDSVHVASMPDRVHTLVRDKQGRPTGSVEADIEE